MYVLYIYMVDMDTYSMSNLNLTPGVNHVRPTQYVCFAHNLCVHHIINL